MVKLLASPTYVLVTTTFNEKEGIELLNDVIAAITAEMKTFRGSVVVKMPVRASLLWWSSRCAMLPWGVGATVDRCCGCCCALPANCDDEARRAEHGCRCAEGERERRRRRR